MTPATGCLLTAGNDLPRQGSRRFHGEVLRDRGPQYHVVGGHGIAVGLGPQCVTPGPQHQGVGAVCRTGDAVKAWWRAFLAVALGQLRRHPGPGDHPAGAVEDPTGERQATRPERQANRPGPAAIDGDAVLRSPRPAPLSWRSGHRCLPPARRNGTDRCRPKRRPPAAWANPTARSPTPPGRARATVSPPPPGRPACPPPRPRDHRVCCRSLAVAHPHRRARPHPAWPRPAPAASTSPGRDASALAASAAGAPESNRMMAAPVAMRTLDFAVTARPPCSSGPSVSSVPPSTRENGPSAITQARRSPAEPQNRALRATDPARASAASARSRLAPPDIGDAHEVIRLDDGRPNAGLSYPDYVDYHNRAAAAVDLAAFGDVDVTVRLEGTGAAAGERAGISRATFSTCLGSGRSTGGRSPDATICRHSEPPSPCWASGTGRGGSTAIQASWGDRSSSTAAPSPSSAWCRPASAASIRPEAHHSCARCGFRSGPCRSSPGKPASRGANDGVGHAGRRSATPRRLARSDEGSDRRGCGNARSRVSGYQTRTHPVDLAYCRHRHASINRPGRAGAGGCRHRHAARAAHRLGQRRRPIARAVESRSRRLRSASRLALDGCVSSGSS